ncbi:MAG TPA: peptidoglycan editing factor PgeF [Papillibacter sp.]|jgi:YfiH family protein|nr:peptidoglycan editing factor PgeF [Papillibacter sp.]
MAFCEIRCGDLVYFTSSLIPVPHAFTTRHGGISCGIFETLNLGRGLGDDPKALKENYARVSCAVGFEADRFVFSRQVHGDTVRPCTAVDALPPEGDVPYEADGLITNEKNVPLVISVADCVPILLYDPVRGAVGAVHAGWRGTVQDIAAKAVRRLAAEYGSRPEDIRAALGPSISLCCFETGPEVAKAVSALLGPRGAEFALPRGDKYMVDLKGINAHRLEDAGLSPENIDISHLCTSCRCETFWSHRKTKGKRGGQAALIMMKG